MLCIPLLCAVLAVFADESSAGLSLCHVLLLSPRGECYLRPGFVRANSCWLRACVFVVVVGGWELLSHLLESPPCFLRALSCSPPSVAGTTPSQTAERGVTSRRKAAGRTANGTPLPGRMTSYVTGRPADSQQGRPDWPAAELTHHFSVQCERGGETNGRITRDDARRGSSGIETNVGLKRIKHLCNDKLE